MYAADIDECELYEPCHECAECTNTFGGYKCKCKDGYRGNGYWCIKKGSKGNYVCVYSPFGQNWVD